MPEGELLLRQVENEFGSPFITSIFQRYLARGRELEYMVREGLDG